MTFFILPGQITNLFLAIGLVTTLSFDSEILSYIYGGGESELYSTLTSNSKTLALKPKKPEIQSNLLVQTKNGNFYFDLKSTSSDLAHKFIDVTRGQVDLAFQMVKQTADFEIWEGEHCALVKNKRNKEISINDISFKENAYFSKGVPLFYQKQRVHN